MIIEAHLVDGEGCTERVQGTYSRPLANSSDRSAILRWIERRPDETSARGLRHQAGWWRVVDPRNDGAVQVVDEVAPLAPAGFVSVGAD